MIIINDKSCLHSPEISVIANNRHKILIVTQFGERCTSVYNCSVISSKMSNLGLLPCSFAYGDLTGSAAAGELVHSTSSIDLRESWSNAMAVKTTCWSPVSYLTQDGLFNTCIELFHWAISFKSCTPIENLAFHWGGWTPIFFPENAAPMWCYSLSTWGWPFSKAVDLTVIIVSRGVRP